MRAMNNSILLLLALFVLWIIQSILLGGLNAEKQHADRKEAQAKAIARLYPKKV